LDPYFCPFLSQKCENGAKMVPNMFQNGAPKRPSAPFLCSFFANVTSQNTTVFIDVNASGPNFGRSEKSKKWLKMFLQNEHAAGALKKEAQIDFWTKSCQKGPKMRPQKFLRKSPFQLPNPACKKNPYKIAPKLTLGLDLGPILAHSGNIF
jgi:hypothetical protein